MATTHYSYLSVCVARDTVNPLPQLFRDRFDHFSFFFFNDSANTDIYTLSLHDALPISEEHTSELQSPCNLVCRLLLEKKTWANRTIFDAVAQLPADQYFRDLKSSYGGIHGTLAHIVWAEQLRSEEHTSELQSPCNIVCR